MGNHDRRHYYWMAHTMYVVFMPTLLGDPILSTGWRTGPFCLRVRFFAELCSVVVVTTLAIGRTARVPDSVSKKKHCSELEDEEGVKGRSAALLLLLSKMDLACCAAICASSIIPSDAFLNWVCSR